MKKRNLSAIVIALMIMLFSSYHLFSQNNLQIPSAGIAPVIDGTIDAVWDNVQPTQITNVIAGNPTSASDFSAYFKTLWDDKALYVLTVVTDDAKINDSGSIWNDDAVEIYIDVNNDKLTSYGSNDFQYTFRWNDATVYSNNGGTSGIEFKMSGTANGYILETKFPWNSVGQISAKQGTLLGFDLQIHDDDDGGDRDNKFAWYATSDNTWSNPSLMATVKLMGDINVLSKAEKPKVSVDRGFYKNPFDVTLSTSLPGMKIFYTLDGTDPIDTTKALAGYSPVVVHIDPESGANRGKTPAVVLRARSKKAGYDFSYPTTRTYLFIDKIALQTQFPGHDWPATEKINDQDIDLLMDTKVLNDSRYKNLIDYALTEVPTISLSTDMNNLFDASTGIYVNAWNARGLNWERPVSVELINPNGSDGFQIDAGLRIRGGWSRNGYFRKHAFRLFFRSDYGEGKLKFPLFEKEGADSFDKVDIRCPQNYSWSKGGGEAPYCTFTRDVFSRDLQHAMNEPYTRSRYYQLYINGLYWGLYQTQERSEAKYAATYLGGNADDYDVVKREGNGSNIEATDGTLDTWKTIYEMCQTGFASNTNYYKLQGLDATGKRDPNLKVLVNIDNLIDYMNVIFYTGNFDAPVSSFMSNKGSNNFYAVYNRNDEKGFMFFAHDNEHTLLYDPLSPGYGVTEDRVNIGTISGDYKMEVNDFYQFHPQWLHFKLCDNPEYRQRFADRAYKYYFNNGVCTPDQVKKMFLVRTYQIDTAIIAESARWGDVDSWVVRTKDDSWIPAVNQIVNQYFPVRTNIVIDQLKSAGLLSNISAPLFKYNNSEITGPQIKLNAGNVLSIINSAASGSVKYTIDGSDPRLTGGNVSPTAIDGSNQTNISILQTCIVKARVFSGGNWSPLHTLNIYVDTKIDGLQITEINYNPIGQSGISGSEFEFLELKNSGSSTINLTSSTFIDGIKYTFSNETTVEPGKFIVLASSAFAFKLRYGFSPNGEFEGQLDNGGERITLVNAIGDTIVSLKYNDKSPWPTTPDSLGFSLVPAVSNLYADWNDGRNWKASASIGGSPNADDQAIPISNVYINEILSNSDVPKVDAVEIFNPNNSVADISNWYLSDNRNNPKKWKIPSGTTIPANGYLTLYEGHYVNGNMAYNTNEFGSAFSLSSHGDQIYLFSGNSSGNLTGYEHGFDFGEIEAGVTFGRYINSIGKEHFVAMATPTLNSINSNPRVGPVVINQIMYHPQSEQFEYLELVNISSESINLYENTDKTPWKVSGIDFTFPMNTSLKSGESVYLVEASISPEDFRNLNNLDNSVKVYNYSGALKNEGEEITLFKSAPQYTEDNQIKTPYIRIDKVDYNDNENWPDADGNGYTLQRISANAYGNDPINWKATPPGIKIKTISLPDAIEKTIYSKQLLASGGTVPYSWSITAGNLPNGTSLNPSTGTIEGTPNQTGKYSFSLKVEDQTSSSDEASFTLTVKENTLPVAVNDTIYAYKNYTVIDTVLFNDIDNDGDKPLWTVSISTAPLHGTASINPDKTITYIPSRNFIGTDKLTYKVTDGKGSSEAQLILFVKEQIIIASVESRVSVNTDDMEENKSTHVLYESSTDLELAYDSGSDADQVIGIRFQNVQIPLGATVTKAYIQFKTDETGNTSANLTINGEKSTNPVTFSVTNLVSSRTATTASINWQPQSWDQEGEISQKQQTPDLSSIVTEIIKQGGWSPGNAMAFLITGTGTRTAEAFEGDAAGAPLLHIEYQMVEIEAAIPVAVAGTNLKVIRSSTVQLNGSSSQSSDGRSLNYHWTLTSKPEGSNAAISNPNIVNPTFIADQYGTYQATLIVDNGINNSDPSTITIVVENQAPVANAGSDQKHMVGTSIHLNGSGSSDPDGDQITYLWNWIEKPQASKAQLSDAASVNPYFTADIEGTYTLSLVVSDASSSSSADQVSIIIVKNQAPTANAGKDQQVIAGTTVSLDGSKSSDPEDDQLTYSWEIYSKPTGSSSVLSSTTATKPTIQPDKAGTYKFRLTVSDGQNVSTPDEVIITVTEDKAPVANAGEDRTLNAGQKVTLDGSSSYDPEGKTIIFQWSIITKPAGSTATLSNSSSATPSFFADISGLYALKLRVSDGTYTSEDLVQINALHTNEVVPINIYSSIKVYPNPFKDKLVVDYFAPCYQKVEINLCTVLGATIKKFEFMSTGNCSKILDLSDIVLEKGFYLLIVKPEKGEPRTFKINQK